MVFEVLDSYMEYPLPLLRASAWETGADLEKKVGSILLKIITQSRCVEV